MDIKFWTAFVSGLCFGQALMGAVLGFTTLAVFHAAIGGFNLYLYGKISEADLNGRTDTEDGE